MLSSENKQRWSPDELQKIAEADDLKIAPFREDGVTYGTPTWIWNVTVDGALYVRAYHGQNSRWYQSAIAQKAGRIYAVGLIRDVLFEPVEELINDDVDKAYRLKYSSSPYLKAMVSHQAKSATVRIVPT